MLSLHLTNLTHTATSFAVGSGSSDEPLVPRMCSVLPTDDQELVETISAAIGTCVEENSENPCACTDVVTSTAKSLKEHGIPMCQLAPDIWFHRLVLQMLGSCWTSAMTHNCNDVANGDSTEDGGEKAGAAVASIVDAQSTCVRPILCDCPEAVATVHTVLVKQNMPFCAIMDDTTGAINGYFDQYLTERYSACEVAAGLTPEVPDTTAPTASPDSPTPTKVPEESSSSPATTPSETPAPSTTADAQDSASQSPESHAAGVSQTAHLRRVVLMTTTVLALFVTFT